MLEDTDNDGKMDKKTIFADKLQMPRALKVLDQGVLVGEPPNLWLDERHRWRSQGGHEGIWSSTTYGNPNGGIEHNANSLYWAMDNTMYSSEHTWDLRSRTASSSRCRRSAAGSGRFRRMTRGRIYRNVNDSPLYVDFTPARYFLRNPNIVRTRGLYEPIIDQLDATVYPGAAEPRRQSRLPRSVLPQGRFVDRHPGRGHAHDLSRQ